MDNNDGLSVVPTTNIDDTTPPGSQQSITPSGTSGTSTLASKNNVQLQSPGSAAYGGFHSFDVASTSHAENMQSSGNSGMGSHSHTNFGMNANSVAYQPRAKLPKLVLPKFRGENTQWQGFWDSFNSAIHANPHLSLIDKFNHLHSLLEGQAARAIQGLTRTEANYKSAIEILHKRFGRVQNMISTHMDEMLKIPACTSDKAAQLRLVYDKISINIRGLESLGVSSHQYGSLLIPVIMSKLPHEIRIQVARNTAKEVWEMSDLLEVIRQEVEAREISEGVKTNVSLEKLHPNHHKTPTTNALLSQDGKRFSSSGNQIKCVYCGGLHYSASCENVSDPLARFEILRKSRRCFVC